MLEQERFRKDVNQTLGCFQWLVVKLQITASLLKLQIPRRRLEEAAKAYSHIGGGLLP